MKKLFCLPILFLFFSNAYSQLIAKHLLCENLIDPININVQQPRFSWQLVSDKINVNQSAYEIKITNGKKEVWNSGKIISDSSINVTYKGKPLTSGTKYTWQVRISDKENNISPWSESATFQTGLLSSNDWKAKWI